jgi:hypothetical protein
LKNKKDETPQ